MKKWIAAASLLLAFCFANDLLRLFEGATPSVSTGTPASGSLKNGKRLPTRGANYVSYSLLGSALGRTAVHSTVRDIVLAAYAELEETAPDHRFVYGETGWPWGGSFKPHRTHQNGTSVDFMVPVRKGEAAARLPTWPWLQFGYAIELDAEGRYGDLVVDFEAIALHLKALEGAARARGAKVDLVIIDPRYQKAVKRAGARGVRFNKEAAWVRHDEHYHVNFELGG